MPTAAGLLQFLDLTKRKMGLLTKPSDWIKIRRTYILWQFSIHRTAVDWAYTQRLQRLQRPQRIQPHGRKEEMIQSERYLIWHIVCSHSIPCTTRAAFIWSYRSSGFINGIVCVCVCVCGAAFTFRHKIIISLSFCCTTPAIIFQDITFNMLLCRLIAKLRFSSNIYLFSSCSFHGRPPLRAFFLGTGKSMKSVCL